MCDFVFSVINPHNSAFPPMQHKFGIAVKNQLAGAEPERDEAVL